MPYKVPKTTEDSFANHPKSQFWSPRNAKKPHQVSKGSGEKYWFKCDNIECLHEFQQAPNGINRGRWCPYCTNQQLCENDECQICYNKSFASIIHTLPNNKIWSTNNTETPRQIFKTPRKQFLFICTDCTHEFLINLYDISRGRGCNYCASKILCDNDNCQVCFDKSFASHYRAQFWSNTNNTIPRKIFKVSGDSYNFNCTICNHVFNGIVKNITSNSSVWCPYCSIPTRKLCANNDCEWCFTRSFASHPKSEFWSGKNDKTPREVIKCSNDKYLFNCNYCNNEITQMPTNIVCKKRWCNICINKTEKKLYEYFLPLYPTIIKEFKRDWCKNINHLPFDFCIEEHHIIIELDGRQHFTQVSNWESPEQQQDNDKYKMQKANENGYSVIRIIQEDVLFDSYDWKTELHNNIEQLKQSSIPTNIFMCANQEYTQHPLAMVTPENLVVKS